jgi:hypothetical protein
MFALTKTAVAAILIAGSATLALADQGTDPWLDTSRTGFVQQQGPFASSQVALPSEGQTVYVDRKSANHD